MEASFPDCPGTPDLTPVVSLGIISAILKKEQLTPFGKLYIGERQHLVSVFIYSGLFSLIGGFFQK